MEIEAMKCFVIAKNPGKNTKLTVYRSSLSLTENESGVVFLSWKYQRVCRNISREYKLVDLVGLFTDLVSDGKVAFCFRNPREELLVNADQPDDLNLFLIDLDVVISSRHLDISLDRHFNPEFSRFISVEHFDRTNLDAKHLSTVILENCVLSSMPIDIGNLPISYLSLSGCTINTQQREFWDWMSMDTISKTLIIFEMNSIGLNALPFEIFYLSKLQTLSVAKNNLVGRPS
ncbi:Leucine-rich repeat domain, L domain-like [Cinara cedri]|uniref:Leucine-rich repeat domain, L domain-like n=1 Tax=Cinara cedri TaxID=506608 RepID=A0A5E4NN34_9HEMI|nr:Leucine-rich repeat domain, L domain-like [Cinara cedri]